MTVLDTDFLIDVMRGDPQASALLEELLAGYDPVAVSAITVMQLHHGIPRARVPRDEAERIRKALRGLATYPITHDIAARAGELDGSLVAAGQRLDPADVLVAVTALHYDEPVATRNRKDYERVAGVRLLAY